MSPMEFVVRSLYPDAAIGEFNTPERGWIVYAPSSSTRGVPMTLGVGKTRSMAWISAADSVVAAHPSGSTTKAAFFAIVEAFFYSFELDELEVA